MVKLRLTRLGKKKNPFYRIIAADARARRDGRFIEQLGYYDPMKNPADVKIDLDRVDYWMGHGAQATDTVRRLIDRMRAAPAEAAPSEA